MIVPVLAVIVLLWLFLTYKARQRVRRCRWRQNRRFDTEAGRYFVCASCGAETRRADGRTPPVCLKPEGPDDG